MRRIGRSNAGRTRRTRRRNPIRNRSRNKRLTARRTAANTKTKQKPSTAGVKQPAASVATDKKNTGVGSIFNRIGGAISSAVNVKPDAAQRKAFETMNKMLEPDKLGGKDRVFNHQDRDAIVNGLIQDRKGMVKEAVGQLRKEGKNFQARMVESAFSGRTTGFKARIQDKVIGQVKAQVAKQLDAGLNGAKVERTQDAPVDNNPRNLTFQELRAFEEASKVAQEYQKAATKGLFDVNFPGGISQDAMKHTLEGKGGIPPGGVIRWP